MPAPRRPASLRRLLAAAVAGGAALLAGGCGDSGTSTSTQGGAATPCADTAACTVGGAEGSATAASTGCGSRGSGRTDDFHQAVPLRRLSDGLQIGDIAAGSGPPVQNGQVLTVAYSGWLQDGTLFDSSRRPGAAPIQVVLGAHGVIPGFEEALSSMHVGGIRRVVIPPELGYGAQAPPPIPANATLTFDLEVLCAQ